MWLYKMCMQILNTEAQKYKGEHVVECKHSELDEGYFWAAVGHENISVIQGTTMEEAKIIKKWSDTVQLIFFPPKEVSTIIIWYIWVYLHSSCHYSAIFCCEVCLALKAGYAVPGVSSHVCDKRNTVSRCVSKNEAVECFNVVMSSTVHPHVLLLELLRLPQCR